MKPIQIEFGSALLGAAVLALVVTSSGAHQNAFPSAATTPLRVRVDGIPTGLDHVRIEVDHTHDGSPPTLYTSYAVPPGKRLFLTGYAIAASTGDGRILRSMSDAAEEIVTLVHSSPNSVRSLAHPLLFEPGETVWLSSFWATADPAYFRGYFFGHLSDV